MSVLLDIGLVKGGTEPATLGLEHRNSLSNHLATEKHIYAEIFQQTAQYTKLKQSNRNFPNIDKIFPTGINERFIILFRVPALC